MRMAIKLMIARQRQSRDVKKRTAFILHFSKHATKKTSHVNQERSGAWVVLFLRCRGTQERREALRCPPRDAANNFLADCYVKFADRVTHRYTVGIEPCQGYDWPPGSVLWNLWWSSHKGLLLLLLFGSARNISVFRSIIAADAAQNLLEIQLRSCLCRHFWTIAIRTLRLHGYGERRTCAVAVYHSPTLQTNRIF